MDGFAESQIETVERNGRMVVLNDGTIWTVDPSHSRTSVFWRPGMRVVVAPSADAVHPFTLTNLDAAGFEVVLANRL